MPNPNAFLDVVSRIDVPSHDLLDGTGSGAPTDQAVKVQFASGRRARLDPADPRTPTFVELLQVSSQDRSPVYVEVGPEDESITELLIPTRARVHAITTTTEGDFRITLTPSEAPHRLRGTNPSLRELLAILEEARRNHTLMSVTESLYGEEIIDARPAPGKHPPARAGTYTDTDADASVDTSAATAIPAPNADDFPPSVVTPVSAEVAARLFELVRSRTCQPFKSEVGSGCIPFLLPRNGCWVRAHEMCRLMSEAGAKPNKVWIYGSNGYSLNVDTENDVHCEVSWQYHVTPTLLVDDGSGPRVMVLDPSMFPGSVSQEKWKSCQKDENAILVPTSMKPYCPCDDDWHFEPDEEYSMTEKELSQFLKQLRRESLGPKGAPPFESCKGSHC